MITLLTQNDEAAIRGCYLNGCSVDQIYSVFEGMYTKDDIKSVVEELIKRTNWIGKEQRQKKFNYSYI